MVSVAYSSGERARSSPYFASTTATQLTDIAAATAASQRSRGACPNTSPFLPDVNARIDEPAPDKKAARAPKA